MKFSGISITNLIYLFGFLSVPVFAYLILLDTKSAVLGNVLSIVGGLVLIYVSYIIYDYKFRKNDNAMKMCLPHDPAKHYKLEWKSWQDYLGVE